MSGLRLHTDLAREPVQRVRQVGEVQGQFQARRGPLRTGFGHETPIREPDQCD